MGCDIHLVAEYLVDDTDEKPKWVGLNHFTENEEYGWPHGWPKTRLALEKYYTHGRNYNLFAALCGVRRGHFENPPEPISRPKGKPKDASYTAKFMIKELGTDGHSHSYLTLEELDNYDWTPWGDTCTQFRREVVGGLRKVAEKKNLTGDKVRIVFCFDN